ncbi:hypothetical protein PACTADRAFT_47819 [Pachysolen tannophilus NRRL Y-2460]|uniref:FHA domain-containing protein n=1 Tax=Pachysolen tannophilus NRRL Y-2460 TaxID=669874 RepID=A0A1E4U1V5_PACTA|nr:hypothetical protein PACTADRAFT_47819 [Pachysolen tannophilus NRRL Y-2460]
MGTDQFPPSSPLLIAEQDQDRDHGKAGERDSFTLSIKKSLEKLKGNNSGNLPIGNAKESLVYQREYPTPNPSSSTGVRFSSPASKKIVDTIGVAESVPSSEQLMHSVTGDTEKKVEFQLPPQVSSPIEEDLRGFKKQISTRLVDSVKSLKLPVNGEEVKIGRSSKSSDYQIDGHNKLISRIHLTVQLLPNEELIVIKCYGHNGLNITIPRHIKVKYLGNEKDYLIDIPKNEKNIEGMGIELDENGEIPRIISNESNFSNLFIMKGEKLIIPKMKGVVLDIRGELLSIDCGENGDDDKESEVTLGKTDNLAIINTPNIPNTPERPKTPIQLINKTPGEPTSVTIKNNKFKIYKDDNETSFTSQQHEDVFSSPPRHEEYNNQNTVLSENFNINNNNIQKKAISHLKRSDESINKSHLKKSKKQNIGGKQEELFKDLSEAEIDEILKPISEDLNSITNVLINHLAFSRLSSTPVSILKTVSKKIESMDERQLRVLLVKRIDCIGVIYRVGKDAAGKPLDEEYYYIVEKDPDDERRQIVNSLKGTGLRNCRKTHKQYFWKKPAKK